MSGPAQCHDSLERRSRISELIKPGSVHHDSFEAERITACFGPCIICGISIQVFRRVSAPVPFSRATPPKRRA